MPTGGGSTNPNWILKPLHFGPGTLKGLLDFGAFREVVLCAEEADICSNKGGASLGIRQVMVEVQIFFCPAKHAHPLIPRPYLKFHG